MQTAVKVLVAALAAFAPGLAARAWGPDGHRLIGTAAEALLCESAKSRIARLGDGEALGQIGLWADEIRGRPEWRHAAPWHYVNVDDDGDPRRPPVTDAGNVIVAIERFSGELTDPRASERERATALRFLVHFIGDVHQPLHVGRAQDRGGNLIDVRYGDDAGNLHAFWDTGVIRLRQLTVSEYAQSIAGRVRTAARRERGTQVRDWAAQVFALRGEVYSFDERTGRLDEHYLAMAGALAEEQLILAAAHLANTLNDALCD
ncbi:MAG: S1/P1 nuclease [Gammaproteobacteria bacterium]|jgi:hypothetical protein